MSNPATSNNERSLADLEALMGFSVPVELIAVAEMGYVNKAYPVSADKLLGDVVVYATYSLDEIFDMAKDWQEDGDFPKGLIPFAYDESGNSFCWGSLVAKGIFYFDMEAGIETRKLMPPSIKGPVDVEAVAGSAVCIASSFPEFFERLREPAVD